MHLQSATNQFWPVHSSYNSNEGPYPSTLDSVSDPAHGRDPSQPVRGAAYCNPLPQSLSTHCSLHWPLHWVIGFGTVHLPAVLQCCEFGTHTALEWAPQGTLDSSEVYGLECLYNLYMPPHLVNTLLSSSLAQVCVLLESLIGGCCVMFTSTAWVLNA